MPRAINRPGLFFVTKNIGNCNVSRFIAICCNSLRQLWQLDILILLKNDFKKYQTPKKIFVEMDFRLMVISHLTEPGRIKFPNGVWISKLPLNAGRDIQALFEVLPFVLNGLLNGKRKINAFVNLCNKLNSQKDELELAVVMSYIILCNLQKEKNSDKWV